MARRKADDSEGEERERWAAAGALLGAAAQLVPVTDEARTTHTVKEETDVKTNISVKALAEVQVGVAVLFEAAGRDARAASAWTVIQNLTQIALPKQPAAQREPLAG